MNAQHLSATMSRVLFLWECTAQAAFSPASLKISQLPAETRIKSPRSSQSRHEPTTVIQQNKFPEPLSSFPLPPPFSSTLMARCLRLQLLTVTLIVLEVMQMVDGQCPPHFKTILSVCVNISSALRTYCETQAYCHGIGGEIITGSNYMKFDGRSFSGIPKRYWIGLADLKE